ncbi:ABC transporter ATP-binding protein [Kytococcus schroeteri]|uniref:ABC transporter ATP-binding protein n=1 Tax=Kytococcus schroeteri TaxID=138300 RepID=UPI00192D0417|nr:ATP-binding cassette domain-containing protein [Kytococcus schroeteri]
MSDTHPAPTPAAAGEEARTGTPPGPGPVVRLAGVTAAPAPGTPEVLRGIDLELLPGTTTAVTGPNGAGKSTLCRVVAGLVTPSAGTVEVAGRALHPGVPAAGVAMLFQSPRRSVSPRMTLRQAIAEPVELRRSRERPSRRAVREAVDAAAAEVGLTPDLLSRRPAAVSDGQLQRAALARALVMEPAVLLADEATAMLDPATTASVVGLLRARAASGLTVLTISHDAELLEAWCAAPGDRVLELAALSRR